jgi:hypothetical protein
MNTAAKKAASLAKETPRFGSDGDMGMILSTSDWNARPVLYQLR